MQDQILDDGFADEQEKEKVSLSNVFSLFLLWVGSLLNVLVGLFPAWDVIIAAFIVLVLTALAYTNWKLGARIALFVLLLGIFNVFAFFPLTYTVGIKFFDSSLGVELINIAVLIVHYTGNRKNLAPYLMGTPRQNEALRASEKRAKINGFKRRFSTKKKAELQEIAGNEMLVPEAIMAARELLEERNQGK